MPVVHFPRDAADPDVSAGLRRITALAWPGADERHDPALEPELFALVVDSAVVAGCAVLTKSIEHGGRTWRASGLSAVVTDPELRGRGYGSSVAAEAKRWMFTDNRTEVGLFTCGRPTAPVYVRAGWAVLEGSVLVGGTEEEPFPSDSPGMDKVVLAGWPSGGEDSVRSAFERSRIALHPGSIDRLW